MIRLGPSTGSCRPYLPCVPPYYTLLSPHLERHGPKARHLVTQVNHSFDVVSTVGIEEGIYDLRCIDPRHSRHPVIEIWSRRLTPNRRYSCVWHQ